ncbi:MAG TPA: TolC family outer membrane protein [Burkholderiales bacterium]|nr:TolC family outer membrane protein [Burkholderiales bacterium]
MKLKPVFAILLSLSPPAHAADLVSIYDEAKMQDPLFLAAKAALSAAQEKVPEGRSLLLPSIGLGANTTYNHFSTALSTPVQAGFPLGGSGNYNSNGYTVSLSQPVFQLQSWIQFDEAHLQVAAAEAQYQAAEQDLILRTASAYFDVLLARDNVELVLAQKKAISEQLQQAKQNFEVGTATITDTHDAQARFDLISAQQIAAQSDLEIRKRTLATLIGKMPGELDQVNPKFEPNPPVPDDVQKWVDAAIRNNLQFIGSQIQEKIAEKEVERHRAGHYPTLNIVASYGENSASGGPLLDLGYNTKSSAIGLQFNLPIYQGGGISAQTREAAANLEKSKDEEENSRRNAELNTREAFLGVANGMAQVKALEQALISSRTSLESTELGSQVGVRTAVDVLNAQQQLYSAKRDLYKARYDYLLSELKLKAASGSLKPSDLTEVNRALH